MFLEVTTRAINKLPGEMRAELLNMISPFAIAVTLAFWAASHFVGAGEVIDLALFAAGVFMLGSAIVGVMAELGECLVTTYNAGSEQELDAAATMLSHVISVIGVATLVALLAKIRANRGSAMASESAAVEAGQAARAARNAKSKSAAPTEPARPHVEEAAVPPKTTNKSADCPGNQCTQAGEPVSMVTGEEMLELEDFTWDGPLALRWRRFYLSGSSAVERVLGEDGLEHLYNGPAGPRAVAWLVQPRRSVHSIAA